MRAVVTLCVLLASCQTLVDVDDYTFEEEPCGPRPSGCTGGRELAFVLTSLELPRADAQGRRDGFDLDGTDEPICAQSDFTSYDGRAGIDNALASVFELYEGITMMDLHLASQQQTTSGTSIQIVVLSHVDDLANDDCIEVTRRSGVLPMGVTAADLDRDGDGVLDPGLLFDYQAQQVSDVAACSIDGVVNARFPTSVLLLPAGNIETRVDHGRLRMAVTEAGAHRAMIAGSIPVDALVGQLPEVVIEFLRPRADLEPSRRAARDCGSISFGLYAELAPCRLGVLRGL